jgi:transposase
MMATRYPAEFRERAVELARLREKPVKQLAADLGISDQTLHNWMKQADIDEGRREGLTTEERAELVRLRRRNRLLEMEIEILKKASAYFARENVLPK